MYRFEDAYRKVYEYDDKAKGYVFIGTYRVYGLTPAMTDEAKSIAVDNDRLYDVCNME